MPQKQQSTTAKKNNNKKKNKKNNATKEVPLECTDAEFEELLSQASSLTADEAKTEIIDCARYGEVDAVRAILDVWQEKLDKESAAAQNTSSPVPFVDSTDSSHNTALHKCCANGHLSTAKLLLSRGASHLPNESGNTPLHWAAANGHESVVEILLKEPRLQKDMDVLAKNKFGRSALTEGFSSSNTKLVGMLLEHDSAEEEKLLSGAKPVDADDDDQKLNKESDGSNIEGGADLTIGNDGTSSVGSSSTTCVVHEFDFCNIPVEDVGADQEVQENENSDKKKKEKTVLIRELPIAHADDPFGDEAIDDTTGLGIWCASLVMSRWVASPAISKQLGGKSIVELGAGCGIPGLAAAVYSNAKSVCLTDLNPATTKNLQHNIDINGKADAAGKENEGTNDKSDWSTRVTAASIDWGDESTWPADKVDIVIGSDLIYQSSIVPLLRKVVTGLLGEHGIFLYVAPDTGRDGLPEFIKVMKGEGFTCVEEIVAPASYCSNPLKSGDEEDCFLHFHELASTTYILYKFCRT